ncbi:MAG: DUF5615 family PIN-like protein [Acidimicrobiales bacterium]
MLDEMLPPAAATELNERGHDAVSVHHVDLRGAPDEVVFDLAVEEGRVMVTEDFGDYSALIEQRLGAEKPCVPVVFVRRSDLAGHGALANHLARRLDAWASDNPEPYVGPHWP